MGDWLKQTDKPLFENLLWSKPENKQAAGKLLIIGGQKDNFSHVAATYEAAVRAGAGAVRVLLPESLHKVAHFLPDVEFAPVNKSGGFSSSALDTMLDLSSWADMVLLAGDFGKSSETTTLLDNYLKKHSGPLAISSRVLESIDASVAGKNILLVTEFEPLQKLSKDTGASEAFTSDMGAVRFSEVLHNFADVNDLQIVAYYQKNIWVAAERQVSSTEGKFNIDTASAYTSVWLMQNPSQLFKALTTACFETRAL